MGYRIKWRFLVKLAIVLLVAGGTIFFVHRRQVKSQVGAFLRHADQAHAAAEQAAKDGNSKAAGEERDREQTFLQRYLLARPDDVDIRERLARLMCENAKTERQELNAYFVLEDVLRRDESRDELRRYAIDYAMNRVGLFKEAKDHLDFLFTKDKDQAKREKNAKDGDLRGMYGRCLAIERDFQRAEGEFKRATDEGQVRRETIKIESYYGLAFVQRQLNKPKEADGQIHRMLEKHPSDVQAFLVALRYLSEFGLQDLSAVAEPNKSWAARSRASLVHDAYHIDEGNLDVLIAAARLARAQDRKLRIDPDPEIRITALAYSEEARMLLGRAIELHPNAEGGYLAMASLEGEEGQDTSAILVLRKGLEQDALKDSVDLLHGLMEYQFRTGDVAGANETLRRLQDRGIRPGFENFELARVMMLEDKWREAAASLEKSIQQLQDKPEAVRQAHLLLGRCYEQLGQPERRLSEYNLALPNEVGTPQWGAAMIAIAESEVALGRIEDSIGTYRKAADVFPALWVSVARLELVNALRSSDGKPSFAKVDEALTKAVAVTELEGGRFIPDTTELLILKASVQHYKGEPGEARKELEALRIDKPKSAAVRIELAMQHLREGKFPEALKVLDEAVKEIGDSPEIRLTKARVWSAMKVKDLSGILTDLALKTDGLFPPGTTEAAKRAQKRRLVRGMAEIATASGAEDAASRLWSELASAKPFDIGVHLVRFERANRAGNIGEMKSILAQIAKLDGERGRTTRLAQVALLIRESEVHKDSEPRKQALRKQALHILDELEREPHQSFSGRVYLLQGLIHDLNEDRDLAKDKYRLAIERGESNSDAIRRLIELLWTSGEAEEAQVLLGKLKNASKLGPDFQRLAASVALRAADPKTALQYADQGGVNEKSEKYQDQLWLGHVYWRSKEADKPPEPRYRKATELAPEVMETWLSLIQYLLATGKKDQAVKVIEEARGKVKPEDRGFFTALTYAQLGETKMATDSFEQARKARPNDVRILNAEAEYLFQLGRLAEARAGFERVEASSSASEAEKKAARQRKALTIALDRDHSKAQQALNVVPLTGNEPPAERRAHAVVLGMQRNSEQKKRAIQLLEENEKGSTPGERFFLAQLYSSVGDDGTKLQPVMEELLTSESNRQPHYLRFYSRWLLGKVPPDTSRAASWIDELAKKDPDSLGTAELKARLAAAQKDRRGAWEALRPRADAPGAPLAVIAGVCESIELYDEAELLTKRFIEQNKQSLPQAVLGLAEFYGRRGRTTEGLQICNEMRGKLPMTMVGAAAINVLYNAQLPEPSKSEEVKKVAEWLDYATKTASGKERAVLLQHLAAIRNLQENYKEAASLYRQVLSENPRDALALNNLAYLLSEVENNHEEALAKIELAKQILGDHTVLLDTEALILLKMGQPEKALKLMDEVVRRAPSGSAFFHLAQVELALLARKMRDSDIEARAAWKEAKERNLKKGDLHPREWTAFDELSRLN
jgi:Tfp pilus assembly protein PilF